MNIKVPVSWLKEYLKTDVTAKTLANLLTLSGPSVERIEKNGSDHVFDIEITTNRADAYSIFGIAREAYVITKVNGHKSQLKNPEGLNLKLEPDSSKLLSLNVLIKDHSLCPRFSAIIIDNVKIDKSPTYIKTRLELSGIRSINNIVDISNYIMLELGQPMHTFDFDKIKGSKMILRKSQKGETIKTLDQKTHDLPEGSIVIQDSEKIIDLCGIMGGANSAVTRRTKRVVLFVQAYNPQSIRKTTQSLSFRTEASSRFEKGIDLEGILPALKRAVYLAKVNAGAIIASELIDIYPQKHKPKQVKLAFDKLNKYLGISFEKTKSVQILTLLGFEVKLETNQIIATIPPWRNDDVESDIDLIEEIARIYGYHKLPSKLPSGQTTNAKDSDFKDVIKLKNSLKLFSLTEVISYSIISKNLLALSKRTDKNTVEIANPLTEEWQFMRPNITPSLLSIVSKNQNLGKDIKIFEVARTYLPQKNELPIQDLVLAISLQNSNFYQTKGLIENVFEILQRKIKFTKLAKDSPIFEQSVSAEIKINDVTVGIIGQVKTSILNQFELDSNVSAAEINLTKIYSEPKTNYEYQPISKYPPLLEDISFVLAKILPLQEILDEIKKLEQPLVKKVEIIDVFKDAKLGENKKSVTIRLTIQKTTGTPTQNDASIIKNEVVSCLEKIFRAKIRS